jgi:hypothetical protein
VDYTELLDLVRGSNETLEQINQQLETLGDPASLTTTVAPEAAAGVVDQGTPQPTFLQRQILAQKTKMELQDVLRTKSTAQLHHLFGMQLAQRGTGIPFEAWAASGGMAQAIYDAFRGQQGSALMDAGIGPDLVRALDTGGAAALIRQDLEPFLYELYVREFTAFDRFVKEPANGLTHTFNQITSFGEAQFMSELGTVVDDTSVYERKTTNIAIVATRRGLSLKSQYAVAAGGMSYNPMDLELQGGLRAISARMQKQIFSGQSTNSGGTTSTEDGEYQPNGFDGLRTILNTARAKNVDPLAGTPEDIKHALDEVVAEITQGGGPNPSILWANPLTKISFDQQQDEKTRYVAPNYVDIGVGVRASEINVLTGTVPFGLVKGNFINNYTTQNADGSFNGGENVRDIYALDESTISLPFLGSEGPTVLDIPIGISGQLTHLFIIFGMWGLAVKAIPFSNKLRVKTA